VRRGRGKKEEWGGGGGGRGGSYPTAALFKTEVKGLDVLFLGSIRVSKVLRVQKKKTTQTLSHDLILYGAKGKGR